jgi:hypothetical protein
MLTIFNAINVIIINNIKDFFLFFFKFNNEIQ